VIVDLDNIDNIQFEDICQFRPDVVIILPILLNADDAWELPNLNKLTAPSAIVIYDYLKLSKIREYLNKGVMVATPAAQETCRSKAKAIFEDYDDDDDDSIPILIVIRYDVGGHWMHTIGKLFNKGHMVFRIASINRASSLAPKTKMGEIGKDLILNGFKLRAYLNQIKKSS